MNDLSRLFCSEPLTFHLVWGSVVPRELVRAAGARQLVYYKCVVTSLSRAYTYDAINSPRLLATKYDDDGDGDNEMR